MTAEQTGRVLPPETEAIVLAVLEARVKDAKAIARIPLEPLYADGEKRVIRSPLDDAKIGTVYRTDPPPSWQITNRNLLAEHLAEDPDNVEYVDDIAGTTEQVIAVLREHAPELLARVERVRADAFTAATAAAAAGEEPAPGISRVKPRGILAVRPDKVTAGPAIEALVAARWITWDGQPLELPAGASEEPPPPDEEPVPTNKLCPGCSSSQRLYDRLCGRVVDGLMWHTGCANMHEQRQAEQLHDELVADGWVRPVDEQDAEVSA